MKPLKFDAAARWISRPFEAGDIHKGGFHGPRGTHCAVGWGGILIDDVPWVRSKERAALCRIARIKPNSVVGRWNDNPRTKKSRIASVLTAAYRACGWRVGGRKPRTGVSK